MASGDVEVGLTHKPQHGAFRQLVERALTDQSLTAVVDAHKEVENQSCYRNEEEHHCPRHGLSGLAIVHDDMDDSHCYDDPIDDGEEVHGGDER